MTAESTTAAPSTALSRGLALLLVVLVAGAYLNSLKVPFFFDDAVAVQHNPTIRQLWPLSVPLSPPTEGGTTTGRPVVNLSLAVNHAISGEAVWSYHLFNLLIHATAAVAVMGLVRATLVTPALAPRFASVAPHLAFAAAALWALNPLQTESVTGVAQRTESLCGMFYLLTLYFFVRGATSAGRQTWWALAWTCCLLCMGTKEVMVTAPLVVLLYDRTFLAGNFRGAWSQRRGIHLALASTWLLLGWLLLMGSGARGSSAGFGLGMSSGSYLLQQAKALVLYLRLCVWPHPLVLDYGTPVAHSVAEVWWQGLIVLGLLAVSAWAVVRRPVLGFCGAWFFVILAPSSSVVPLVTQTMAEHRMYLPLAAVVVPAALLLYAWLGGRAWPVLGVIMALWFGLTVARNQVYRDGITLWADTVSHSPRGARAQLNLGYALQEAGRTADAVDHYEQAIALRPDYVMAHYNLGVTQLQRGQPAAAATEFAAVIDAAQRLIDARVNYGNALVRLNRSQEAVAQYESALQLQRSADIHYNYGVALVALGRDVEAAAQFASALQLDPALSGAHYQLARLELQSGHPDAAMAQCGEAVRLAPDHVEAQRLLGLLLAQADKLAPAAEHLEAALRVDPNHAETHANLGNVRLLQGRPADAIHEYETALRLDPSVPVQANLDAARAQVR